MYQAKCWQEGCRPFLYAVCTGQDMESNEERTGEESQDAISW